MLKKLIASLMLSVTLATSTVAYAQDTKFPPTPAPAEGETDPGEAISPMRQGQKAPFTGLLLSPAAIAKIIVELKHVDDKIKIEVDRAVARQKAEDDLKLANLQAQLAYAENTSKLQIEERDRQIKDLDKRLKQEEDARVNPLLLVGGGVLLGAGLVIGSVLASKSSN